MTTGQVLYPAAAWPRSHQRVTSATYSMSPSLASSSFSFRPRRAVPGFDSLDGVFKRPFQNALADASEHESEHPSSKVLALAYHDGVQIGRPVGPTRKGVGVARAASP